MMYVRIWAVLLFAAAGFAQSPGADLFERKIRPVLAGKCYPCHSSQMKSPMGGLLLDTRAGLRTVSGKPGESRLLEAIGYNNLQLKMPPMGKLPEAAIADFTEWVGLGAPDPRRDAVPTPGSTSAAPGRRVVGEKELARGREWWAFQPVRELAAPGVKDNSRAGNKWVGNKIDAFVLATLAQKGLAPSPEAGPRTLVRRVYLDLVGIKPGYDEVEAYANDTAADRYQKLVDRLLASTQYGERWARYWLDIARYAEDNVGNITNPPYPHAWRYRDWVIDALNKDVPYDRFVKLQLAADLMPGTPRDDLRALGYLGLSPIEHKDVRLSTEVIGTNQLNEWDERVDAVSRGLLGISAACARCHDHKFDPIPAKDYYRLASVFASTQRATRPTFDMAPADETRFMWMYRRIFDLNYTANLLEDDPGSKPEQAARQVKKFRGELAELNAEMQELGRKYPAISPYMAQVPYPGEKQAPQPVAAAGAAGARAKERRNRGKQIDPMAPFTDSVYDAGLWLDDAEPDLTFLKYKPGAPRDLPLYRGGNLATPGDPAPRGFLTVLSRGPQDFRNGSGRLELGEKIFTDAAPLSARVIVNRVWGWHFDKPLVSTPSDFGVQGEKPTHPELLEDLAARFIAHGWSLKWLHREILLSAAYRQSSRPRKEAEEIDPSNQWLWRMNPRRLDIEAYRDTILKVSGNLDETMYGAGNGEGNGAGNDEGNGVGNGAGNDVETATRRTVYCTVSRSRTADLLRLYDFPEPVLHSPSRTLTISPLQQLFVLNSPFIQHQAASLAKAVESEPSNAGKVRALYRRILARDPAAGELDAALTYLDKQSLPVYAQALLGTNEVIFWP